MEMTKVAFAANKTWELKNILYEMTKFLALESRNGLGFLLQEILPSMFNSNEMIRCFGPDKLLC